MYTYIVQTEVKFTADLFAMPELLYKSYREKKPRGRGKEEHIWGTFFFAALSPNGTQLPNPNLFLAPLTVSLFWRQTVCSTHIPFHTLWWVLLKSYCTNIFERGLFELSIKGYPGLLVLLQVEMIQLQSKAAMQKPISVFLHSTKIKKTIWHLLKCVLGRW